MKIRALGMVSGGLDSTLATKLMVDLGVEVEMIHFSTGFCITEHTRHFKDKEVIRPNEALRLAADLGLKLHLIDLSRDYLPVVTHPRFGYGENMNPCIDCRIFMMRRMKGLLERFGARFMFTGEVLGQRPMSQTRSSLKTIEMESGLAGLVLRPLSAQFLDPTIPETKGWVDRSRLLRFTGRSRKPQIQAAHRMGLDDYPQPAGGCCYLTDPQYASRLKDLFAHRDKALFSAEDAVLLKVGRHFRVSPTLKVVVGRNEKENHFMDFQEKGKHAFRALDVSSARTIADCRTPLNAEDKQLVARLAARYSDAGRGEAVRVEYCYEGLCEVLTAVPFEDSEIERWKL